MKPLALSVFPIFFIAASMTGSAPVRASDLASPELVMVNRTGLPTALEKEISAGGMRLEPINIAAAPVRANISQTGNENAAELVQSGTRHAVDLVQDGESNRASISQSGALNSLELLQDGNRNTASIKQAGGAHATVVQVGELHKAEISQFSPGSDIAVRQNGTATFVQTTQY